MKMKTETLKRFKGRIKGLAAMGFVVAMAFGMMPSVQAKADSEIEYPSYYFVRAGDKGKLIADRLCSGYFDYYSEMSKPFEGDWYFDKDLNVEDSIRNDFINVADRSEMENTKTIIVSYYGGLNTLSYGYVGKSDSVECYIDGVKQPDIQVYYYSGLYGRACEKIKPFEVGEYDITLHTEKPVWTIELNNIANVTSVAFDKTELNLKQGDAGQKLATSPALNPNRFNWESSDSGIATVDATGTVTPVKGGTATITATMKTDPSIKATCTVKVEGKEVTENPQAVQTEEPSVDRSADTMETGLKITQNKKGLKVKWDAEAGAAKYEVYAAYLGKKNPDKIETTTNSAQIKAIGGKAIDTKKNYEIYVVAYDSKGNKIGTSLKAFVAGKDSAKYTNAKKIKVAKKVSVKKGKTAKVKPTITLADKKKKALAKKYAADVRYFSTDTSIATVSKAGKIKGVAPGTCTVLAIAKNGLAAKIKVTVK
ncbi:Ig-like domain-containing protein [Butyrivibrio sp. AE3006]|uniref:Ig-like domain-containing protein n=1 Tax=Butyrivibrio sp. AE3006 TaxID=1280673 RepID=UPI0004070FBE|nr:Ig-like domain-containing protein [Butyrivibrio sp. AE3006]